MQRHLNRTLLRVRQVLLLSVANLLWKLLTTLHPVLALVQALLHHLVASPLPPSEHESPAHGQTVLVTTGRQAKTLHTVRALKAIGARVIVSDYDPICTSAVSLSCDEFVQLPDLSTTPPDKWIANFRTILDHYRIDVVLPVSTINEVLLLGLAKSALSNDFPHVQWVCPALRDALALDDRHMFSALCAEHGVPCPASGILDAATDIADISRRFPHGIIVKRMESSVNRSQEIVPVHRGKQPPPFVSPSPTDKWQWQQFITGTEKSVWYICLNGSVTFTACYYSAPDLVHFDPAPVPSALDLALRRMMRDMGLSGQFAFDFIEDCSTGTPYVIECNPRSSSVLEVVSTTPRWAEAFFGRDVSHRTQYNKVGFLFHRNCWPWTDRTDGHFLLSDVLPFFAAQVVWPLSAIATKGSTEMSYEKIDVNICKIIVNGLSSPRNLQYYRKKLKEYPEEAENSPHIFGQK